MSRVRPVHNLKVTIYFLAAAGASVEASAEKDQYFDLQNKPGSVKFVEINPLGKTMCRHDL